MIYNPAIHIAGEPFSFRADVEDVLQKTAAGIEKQNVNSNFNLG